MTVALASPMPCRMDDPLVLPLVPMDRRVGIDLLWRLDRRLGEVARRGGEAGLVPIRLRWWADQLEEVDATTSPADPLLAEIAANSPLLVNRAMLVALAMAWGEGDQPARGRALFAASAALLGDSAALASGQAGAGWALADAAARSGEEAPAGWRAAAAALAAIRLSRLPRALAAIVNDAARLAARGGARHPRRDQLALLRVGLFGR